MADIYQGIAVPLPPGGSKWIIGVGDYVDNSFTALRSSDPREVTLELKLGFYVFSFSIC